MKEKVFVVSCLHVVLLFAIISFHSGEAAGQAMEACDLMGADDMAPVSNTTTPSDFAGDDRFLLNTQKIANELSNLTTEEMSQYSITSLSAGDIESVFRFLNEYDLTRLLLNIPQADLIEVKNMLDPLTFNQTINKLSEGNKTQVTDRLSSTLS